MSVYLPLNVLSLCFYMVLFFLTASSAISSSNKPVNSLWDRKGFLAYPEPGERIVDSWAAGQWQVSELSGYFRLVVTEGLYPGNRLYLQWIVGSNTLEAYDLIRNKDDELLDDASVALGASPARPHHIEKLHIAYSVSVRDINEYGEYRISQSDCPIKKSCDLTKVSVAHVFERSLFELNIKALGLGYYSLALEYPNRFHLQ